MLAGLARQAGAGEPQVSLAVTGDDLRAIGFHEGPELGRTLATLLDEVITDPERNARSWLLDRAAQELG